MELDTDVPSLLAVEFPLRVRDVSKGISMIQGGSSKLGKCFIDPEMKLELNLRKDPSSHPLRSIMIKNENVLLKVKLPKGYGKDGVREGIERCIKEGKKWSVNAVGVVKQNYKFRELADFQRLDRGSYGKSFDSFRNGDYKGIKKFAEGVEGRFEEVQSFKNDEDVDIAGLVRYARTDIPINYKFHGNLLIDEDGEFLNKAIKLYSTVISWEEETPSTHDPQLSDLLKKTEEYIESMHEENISEKIIMNTPSVHLVECIKVLKKLFAMKAVWIRKHLQWLIPERLRLQLRFALPFVSYTFKKGPWRHSNIRYGYDPRKDKMAYKSQIEAFRSATGNAGKTNDVKIEEVFIIPPSLHEFIDEFSDKESELRKLGVGKLPRQLFFDGKNMSNSLSFQIGDILDYDVKKVLEGMKIVECNIETGWIDQITLERVKGIIKYKLMCAREGLGVNEDKVRELMFYVKGKVDGEEDDDDGEDDEGEGDDDEDDEDDEEDMRDHEDTTNVDKTTQQGTDDGSGDVDMDSNVLKETDKTPNDIMSRLRAFNPKSSDYISELGTLIQQEQIM